MRRSQSARGEPAAVDESSRRTRPHCGVEFIVGAGREANLATIVRCGPRARLTLITHEDAAAPEKQLAEFAQRAAAAGLVGPPLGPPQCGINLAGAALEMETHVGKRCLLIGDAGGFVAAFSGEGIYPAMESGRIAAECAARALKAHVLQDELATFESAWRSELAEYLRRPNTDLSLLIPLVFNNAQMSKRVARAFLLGQTF